MSAYGGQAEHHRKDYGGDGEQIIRFHAAIDNVEDEDRWPDTVGQQGCWPSGSVKRRQPSIEALVGETNVVVLSLTMFSTSSGKPASEIAFTSREIRNFVPGALSSSLMMLSKTWPTRLIQVLIEERRTGGPEESYIGAQCVTGFVASRRRAPPI